MREIEFRGKDIKTGKWVYGTIEEHLVDGDLTKREREFLITFDIMDEIGKVYRYRHEVVHETVGQYTGLKDTEEVKIYEGDIVKWCGSFKETDGTIKNCESIYTVKWVDGAFYQVDELYTPEYEILSDVISVLDDDETYEVIGNIYDNPELLESEKNGTNS